MPSWKCLDQQRQSLRRGLVPSRAATAVRPERRSGLLDDLQTRRVPARRPRRHPVHSRPHVCLYPEAQFRILRYRLAFPGRFASIEASRAHCQEFFAWYNHVDLSDDPRNKSASPRERPAPGKVGRTVKVARVEGFPLRIRVLRPVAKAQPDSGRCSAAVGPPAVPAAACPPLPPAPSPGQFCYSGVSVWCFWVHNPGCRDAAEGGTARGWAT